jgi:hypothetical protein
LSSIFEGCILFLKNIGRLPSWRRRLVWLWLRPWQRLLSLLFQRVWGLGGWLEELELKKKTSIQLWLRALQKMLYKYKELLNMSTLYKQAEAQLCQAQADLFHQFLNWAVNLTKCEHTIC